MDLKEEALRYGISIDPAPFETYYEMLTDWNQRMNLTAVTEKEEVYAKHFLDSLLLASVISVEKGMNITDIGSGAGFPGMVLAIAFPQTHVTLIEATEKKVRFLQAVSETLKLSNVQILSGRGEELAHNPVLREKSDLVVFRAVASLPLLLELGCGFLKPEGYLAAYKGPAFDEEFKDAEHTMKVLAFSLVKRDTFEISGATRVVAVFQKDRHTPKTYPRKWSRMKSQRL